jgi:hypothetical protein
MIHSKRTTSILLALLLALSTITIAQAYGSGTIPNTSITWHTDDEAYYYGSGSTYFASASESWTSYGQNIGTIGWTSRTNQQVCGGVVVYGYSQGAVANYNTWDAYVGPSSSQSPLYSCPYGGTRQVRVATMHQFKTSASNNFLTSDGDTISAP